MTTGPEKRVLSAAKERDRRHVFHSWSAQAQIDPVVVAGGEGAWFWDEDGNRYLDMASQLVNANLGLQHPAIVGAIKAQADRLCTIAPYHANDQRGRAAELVAEVTPGDLDMIFFTNGGAEATENAIRMARLHTGRHKILSTYRSYHGATANAIAMTGDPRRWPSEPGATGFVHFFGPYPYRSSFGSTSVTQECERALTHLGEVITLEGPHTIAAIILEPVVGTNGVLVPPDGYLSGVRELCDRHGIVMVCDEVMSGFGRCGHWFAVDHWGVTPDLIAFAKGVNSGYVPLGGVAISRRIADSFADRPYPGGLTYSGHPLACASAVASMEAMRTEGLVERARRLGEEVLAPELNALMQRHPSVGEVRGLGCMWAVELVRDRETREMLVPHDAGGAAARPVAEVVAAARARGVWFFAHFNRIHVLPPLITSPDDIRHGISVLDEALALADAHVRG
ncbi:MAG: aspartate aminotransferase family protein [Candidatus Dormibacteria bacterium]